MPDTLPPSAPLLHAIRAIVGDRGLLTEQSDTAPYAEDWRRLYQGRTSAVIRPGTTEELARRRPPVRRRLARRSCRRAAIPPWSAAPRRRRWLRTGA